MSCTSELIRQRLNDIKFTCATTKPWGIVNCPCTVENTSEEPYSAKYVSVSVHDSDRKKIKLVPDVHYFLPHVGIKNKILEFSNSPGNVYLI